MPWGLLLILAGLILLFAGPGWFVGAATVGVICLAVGGFLFVVSLIVFLIAASKVRAVHRRSNVRR